MGEAVSREPVEVRVLGKFEVSVGGRPVELSSGRLRALLAVLAMSAGRAVSADRLIDTVWGDDLPEDARRTTQVYVARLRNALGADAIDTEPAGYVLCTTPDNVDALRFLRLADRAGKESTVERHLLLEALGLWRGAAFEGIPSAYLHETEAVRLDERRLTCLERRFDLDLADDRAAAVVGDLGDLTAEHPLRESLWARYVVALARSGRPAEALEQYETIRSRIAEELGVDPGAKLQQIHTDLLAGVVPAPPRGSADTQREAATVPRQLPADIGGFSGRTRLLEEFDDLLASRPEASGPRTVVVHGTGGVGKTTFAVHWAHRVADRFADGQLYLNLRGYGSGEPMSSSAALDVLLRGLGVPSEEIPVGLDARASLWRSNLADRTLLLVLDNVFDAEQIRPLLPGSGGSMVLVTSRSQLRSLVVHEGAQRISVDLLEPSEAVDLLRSVLDQRRVAHDQSDLAELAQLCGHLPLALAVAAERASLDADAGLADLVVDLRAERDRLDVLDLGDESTDLRAVFAWSYRALEVDTARLFRLLGLHPGADIGLPAAAALAGLPAGQTRRLLDRLVDVNLLLQRRHGRYELHDLLRVYATELAESVDTEDDWEAALDRMFGWYLHSASNARKRLTSTPPFVEIGEPPDDVVPLSFEEHDQAWTWYETERDTLVAVADALTRLGRHRTTYHLVGVVWIYLQRIRALDDQLRLGSAAQSAARRMEDDVAEAHCASLLGMAHGDRLELEAAVAQFERALDRFDRMGDGRMHAQALTNLGVVKLDQKHPEEAILYYQRSIAMTRRIGALGQELTAMNNLAVAYIELRRFEDAARLAGEALERCGQGGETETRLFLLDTLGRAQAGQGRHVDACVSFRRSIQLFAKRQDLWGKGEVLTDLGRSLRALGELGPAREAWQEALDIFDALGKPEGIDFSRDELVRLLADVEDKGDR